MATIGTTTISRRKMVRRARKLMRAPASLRLRAIRGKLASCRAPSCPAMACGRTACAGLHCPATARHQPPPGAIAQLGERLDRTQEVGGSSPPSSIFEKFLHGGRFFSTVCRAERRCPARRGCNWGASGSRRGPGSAGISEQPQHALPVGRRIQTARGTRSSASAGQRIWPLRKRPTGRWSCTVAVRSSIPTTVAYAPCKYYGLTVSLMRTTSPMQSSASAVADLTVCRRCRRAWTASAIAVRW